MKRLSLIALSFTMPLAVMASPVFSDTFGSGSTVDQAPGTPTATSATYETWSQASGQAAATVNPGALSFSTVSTTSTFGEVQAQFVNAPITMATIGDSITLTLVFTDTANIMTAGNTSALLAIGLYNSGGTMPLQGPGLVGGGAFATGGAAGYLGYIGRVYANGNQNYITRPVQTGGSNSSDQDLLFNNASNGNSFNSPTGSFIGGTTLTTERFLTQGNQYGIVYQLQLASGAVNISESMYNYDGSGNQGSEIWGTSVTASGATLVTTNIDSLAFGYRRSQSPSGTSTMTINSILVTDSITPVPEASVFALSGFGLLALGMVRRWKRNS
jgi:hypothetical protein